MKTGLNWLLNNYSGSTVFSVKYEMNISIYLYIYIYIHIYIYIYVCVCVCVCVCCGLIVILK